MAEAVNFATLDWLRQVRNSKSCSCLRSSVKASQLEIYKNLLNSSYNKTQQFLEFQEHILETVSVDSEESEDEKTIKAVKSAFKKKIRKDQKLPKKLVYKKEEYIVDNWIECERCKTWRVVNKNPSKFPHFACKNINKRCRQKELSPKCAFTIT